MADRTIAPIKFDDQQASGLEALAGAPQLMVNSLTDIANTRKPRPGISAWDSFPDTPPVDSPVDAMAVLDDTLVFATRDRRLWSVTVDGVATALSDNTLATQIPGTLRPRLSSFRTAVIAAGGATPQTTDGSSLSAVLGGSPPDLSTLVGIATRVVGNVNDTSGRYQWSGLGDAGHAMWDPLNFAEAEAKPDVIVAMGTNTNELFAFGATTLQVYSSDPVTDFAAGRTLNLGLLARDSVVEVDDQLAFLDRERRFVLTDGRSFGPDSILSSSIEASLRGLTTVSDCWGFRMRLDRWDAPVWMFPMDGKGFIWNRRSRGWSEWRGFGAKGYAAPTITSALDWPEQNVFLVGLDNGQIAKLDANAHTDLGAPIKVELISGFDDNGTGNQKKGISAKFVFKRGQVAQTASEPVVGISWRTDLGPFTTPTRAGMGLAGDYDATVEIRSIGVYRRLQWKIEYTADADFTLIGAQLEFVPLNS